MSKTHCSQVRKNIRLNLIKLNIARKFQTYFGVKNADCKKIKKTLWEFNFFTSLEANLFLKN